MNRMDWLAAPGPRAFLARPPVVDWMDELHFVRAEARGRISFAMLPKPPPRVGQLGFLYIPPLRIQGVSVAGEASAVMVPEFDLCFDIGACHRPMLAAKHVAITHGHMDHVAGLPYYFSQRFFQGMGTGICVCDKRVEPAVRTMMEGWIDLEQQRTSHEIIGLGDGEELEIKNNIFLRAFQLDHTVPTIGYSLVERRTKLRPEFTSLPQDELRRLKHQGTEITRELRVPMVAYIGDALPGPQMMREEVLGARVLVTECTFFEPEHKERALVGKHVHFDDIIELLRHAKCEALVITHVSRRTHLSYARQRINDALEPEDAQRVFLLMDHRENKKRYEQQLADAFAQTPGAS